MATKRAYVQVNGLKKHYGDGDARLTVLDGIDTSINRGEICVMLGPSGSGKSSMCRTINRLETIDSGEILIEGEPLPQEGKDLARMRAELGMVFQQFNLFPNMTILENIMLAPVQTGLMTKEEASKRADELLVRVGLADKADVYPAMLSGGQKQRVAIARALMRHPALLLADEPVASLDPVTGRQILELLRDIQQDQKLTVLMNSHNLELSQEFSSRLIGLNQGTVVLDAPADTPAEDILAAVYHRQEDQP